MERIHYIDYIKGLGLIFVITVHALSHIGFYDLPTKGIYMLILNCVRALVIICVPLFLIATGMLLGEKATISSKYFKKSSRVLVSYFLIMIICILFDISISILQHETINFKEIVPRLLNFTGAPYGWYVPMYLGLFFLAPFINLTWGQLTERSKWILLCILTGIVVIPNTFNSFNISIANWRYGTRNEYTLFMDQFWSSLYPILYYCIGLFLYEKQDLIKKKMDRKKGGVFLTLTIIICGILNYYKYYNKVFGWALDCSYGGIQPFVVSILFVVLLISIQPRQNVLMEKMSIYSLETYLVSYIPDIFVYFVISKLHFSFSMKVVFLIISVPITVLLSLSGGIMISKISRNIIIKGCSRCNVLKD